jgi:hypothetical protein
MEYLSGDKISVFGPGEVESLLWTGLDCSTPSLAYKCYGCNKEQDETSGEEFKLNRCSACKIMTYCSKDCQTAHWPKHKHFCKQLKKSTPTGIQSNSLLYEGYAFRRYKIFEAVQDLPTVEEKLEKEMQIIEKQLRDDYATIWSSEGRHCPTEGINYLSEALTTNNPRQLDREKCIACAKLFTPLLPFLQYTYLMIKGGHTTRPGSTENMQVMQNLAVLTMMLFYEPAGLYVVDRLEEEVKKIKEDPSALKGTLTEILLALAIETDNDQTMGSAVQSTIGVLSVHIGNNRKKENSRFLTYFFCQLTVNGLSPPATKAKFELARRLASRHIQK